MASSHEHDASPSGPDHSTSYRPTVSGARTGAPTPAAPIFLTVDETATLLRTSRKAVYAMAERAQLPGVTRIGRRLLVRRDDLLSWLDERRAASPGGTRR
ncbi:MAG TPA: helix-turn-helix domain-containing protein [Polyangiaceae bacterium]|nr:helix-turn-helix domain-containing protein [Polyangiaceae bacterium]